MTTRFDVERAVVASDLPPAARQLMLTLAVYTDSLTAVIPDEYTPSLTDLEKATGLSRATVARHLARLEKDDWISRIRPESAHALGAGERTKYRLSIPASCTVTLVPSVKEDEPSVTVRLGSVTATLDLVSQRDVPSVTVRPRTYVHTGSIQQQRVGAGEPPTDDGVTMIEIPARIVIEATGAKPSEADAIVTRVRNERNPRSLPALLRHMAKDGELAQLLTEQRAATRKAAVAAQMIELRRAPPCEHGDPGGNLPHPASGAPLCPKCRLRARLPTPKRTKEPA